MSGRTLFRVSAATALALHASVLLARPGLHGGADLRPHLRLIQQMAEAPSLRSVYAPAYHALGALLSPWLGQDAYPQWFAWLSAAALIGAFRVFQRSAGLPDAASALFAFTPYAFAMSACLPKLEAAGYACALLGLAALLRGRPLGVAAALLGAFAFHTAAALFLGLCGGVLALVRRDLRALAALAAGSALAAPLVIAHLAAGCTFAQSLLFSHGDYLRGKPRGASIEYLGRALILANPIALALAAWGAPRLWRARRDLALLCALIALLYLNELWLAPFGMRTTLDLVRGLSVLAIPLACAAGVALDARPRAQLAAVGASAALAAGALYALVPGTCVSRPIELPGIERIKLSRCEFRWREPARPADGRAPRSAAERESERRPGAFWP